MPETNFARSRDGSRYSFSDGKPADAEAVLKALAKPKGVAVFIRSKKDDPAKLDPFYLGLLREDTLALGVEEKDWSTGEP
ncbi:MAG TPA: hypothetical protein VKS79_23660 [Gemmataceae bacterium]|nr:hypothetical protein [Gemmataceae bacterium]